MRDPNGPWDLPDFARAWPCRPTRCSASRHEGLAPRGAYALWTTAEILADEWREALAEVPGDAASPGLDPGFEALPPVARRVASRPWLERFVGSFADLSRALADGEIQLTCTGEEVAFQIILTTCADQLAGGLVVPTGFEDWPGHGDDFDFDLSRVETIVSQDIDVCWLWQSELDGIEADDSPETSMLRPVNLHPRDWFKPFAGTSRIPSPGPYLPDHQ